MEPTHKSTRHSREFGNPETITNQDARIPETTSLDSHLHGNDGSIGIQAGAAISVRGSLNTRLNLLLHVAEELLHQQLCNTAEHSLSDP